MWMNIDKYNKLCSGDSETDCTLTSYNSMFLIDCCIHFSLSALENALSFLKNSLPGEGVQKSSGKITCMFWITKGKTAEDTKLSKKIIQPKPKKSMLFSWIFVEKRDIKYWNSIKTIKFELQLEKKWVGRFSTLKCRQISSYLNMCQKIRWISN